MEKMTQVTIRITNYDDLIDDTQAIIEACQSLNIPDLLMEEWLDEYLKANIDIEVG